MDVFYRIGRLHFVWNEEKADWNNIKHGILFEDAAQVFIDPLTKYDDANADEEDRVAALGMTRERRLLFVVHIEREENYIRIISARPAEASERKSYENHA